MKGGLTIRAILALLHIFSSIFSELRFKKLKSLTKSGNDNSSKVTALNRTLAMSVNLEKTLNLGFETSHEIIRVPSWISFYLARQPRLANVFL